MICYRSLCPNEFSNPAQQDNLELSIENNFIVENLIQYDQRLYNAALTIVDGKTRITLTSMA